MPSQSRGATRREILRRAGRPRSAGRSASHRRRPAATKRSALASSAALRRLGWLAALLVAAWILSMTLRPGNGRNGWHLALFSEKLPALRCLVAGCPTWLQSLQFLWIDVLGNVAVFVPFGAALALALPPGRPLPFVNARPAGRRGGARGRWYLRLAALGAAFSLGIEIAQLSVPGRASDVDDVVLNTLGTLIGGALAALFARFINHLR